MLGARVTAVKIDPYLNVDAGTMSPLEHGECFVLDDGGETDLDLGNYERFLDVILGSDSNLTTGKIYKKVIEKERKGEYLGKTVQIIPHITNEILERIHHVARSPVDDSGEAPDICMIELGGTIGDIESCAAAALQPTSTDVGLGWAADAARPSAAQDALCGRPAPAAAAAGPLQLLPRARVDGAGGRPAAGRAEDQADAAQRQGAAQPRPHARLHRLPLQRRGAPGPLGGAPPAHPPAPLASTRPCPPAPPPPALGRAR